MAETRQTGDKRNRTNPGEFGRNQTNRAKRAKLGKTGQKTGIFRQKRDKTGQKMGKSGQNWAKNGQKRAKNGQTKPNPGKTGRNRKFRRILVRVRSSLHCMYTRMSREQSWLVRSDNKNASLHNQRKVVKQILKQI